MSSLENVLEVSNISKMYKVKNETVYANKNITFCLKEREILAVLGPNGAGKSTLIKQIIGYTSTDSGNIKMKGTDISTNKKRMLSEIGYMMQSRFEHWDHLSIYDAIYYSARLKKVDKEEIKKEIAYLAHELDFEKELRKQIKYLSGGKKQAAALACAVVGNPAILILDEPTTGLDPEKRCLFWKFLKKIQSEKGTSILLITHNVAEVEQIVDRVLIMGNGRILDEGTIPGLYERVQNEIRIELEIKEGARSDEIVNVLKEFHCKKDKKNIYVYIDEARLMECVEFIFQNEKVKEDISNLKIIRPSLEDIYIKIMGEKIEE